MKSNARNGGSFYHSPDPTGGFQEYRDTPVGVIANDDGNEFANDKELMTADSNPSSPKRDNVYMTWTRFNAANHSPIYFSQSTDGGATWSDPIEISGSNAAICTVPAVGPCNDDQGSDPAVGPDGTLYVSFSNGNVPGAGMEQVLNVTCPASADCSNQANWTAPTKVGDMVSTQPVGPPSQNGCPNRQCLPPNGYRAPDETTVTNSVDRERERVRDVGGSPQQHEPELRARRCRRRRPAVRPRHLLRVLDRRRGDVERHDGHHAALAASARPRSGSRGAR